MRQAKRRTFEKYTSTMYMLNNFRYNAYILFCVLNQPLSRVNTME